MEKFVFINLQKEIEELLFNKLKMLVKQHEEKIYCPMCEVTHDNDASCQRND